MSLFHKQSAVCPHCSETVELDANFSVSADRRPDYREAILRGTFQVLPCPSCGESFRLEPEMTYLDIARGQWILVKPARELELWASFEDIADVIFEANYGRRAAYPAQEIGRGLTTRVTFGWPALREKIVVRDLDIDETALELLKLELLRTDDSPPIADDVELRLLERVDDTLRIAWISATSGEILEGIEVPAAALDHYTPIPAPWRPLAERLTAGPFRDIHRLIAEPA